MVIAEGMSLEQALLAMEERMRRFLREELDAANKRRITKHHRIKDVCEALGMSRSTLYRRRKEGEIKAVKSGGIVIIPDDEIQRIELNRRHRDV